MDFIRILDHIAEFMRYLVPGYIFLSCFDFFAYLKREEKAEYLIIKCITISFLFVTLTSLVNSWITLNEAEELLFLLGSAFVSAFFVGKLYRSKVLNNISYRLFNREFGGNSLPVELIWVDCREERIASLKDGVSMRKKNYYAAYITVQLRSNGLFYSGYLSKAIAIHSDPIIYLEGYQCYSINKDTGAQTLLKDMLKVQDAYFIFRYSDVMSIELKKELLQTAIEYT